DGGEAPLYPTLAATEAGELVSASALAQKAKQFDDGLYAAVELAAEQGAGSLPGKAPLLEHLAQALTPQSDQAPSSAPATVLAAAELGKLKVKLPPAARAAVQQQVDAFLGDPVRSKPLAFYTWSEQLAAIFRQDRMLQSELKDKAGTETIVRALAADKQARATYDAYLALVARLTNPLAYPDLRPLLSDLDRGTLSAPARGIYFLPPSQSYETELVKQLYGDRPIPAGFNLVDEMIRRIRSGQLSLKPGPASGWYDYQTWALEPLVVPEKMPEAKSLRLDDSYRRQLLELFKGLLALTRETHIKQVEIAMAGAMAPRPEVVIHISPELSAEPLPTFYYRRAWSYFYIGWALEQAFGAAALEQMHRLTAAGPVKPTLAAELHSMADLFYGAHVTVCRQLGIAPVSSPQLGRGKGAQADTTVFSAWQAALADDPDVGQDARMMVPVFYDAQRRQTKVWAFLGWDRRPVEFGFAQNPAATILDAAGAPLKTAPPRLKFHSTSRLLTYPVTAE
ncbi:MAG TPA: hypothetical protein VHY20_13420, partial [Pirellulales bacterium]|nr:hypothetical protein [Pirellulales bacterium]